MNAVWESDPVEFGGSPGDALVAGAGSAVANFAHAVPWLVNQAVDVVLVIVFRFSVVAVVGAHSPVLEPAAVQVRVLILGNRVPGVVEVEVGRVGARSLVAVARVGVVPALAVVDHAGLAALVRHL